MKSLLALILLAISGTACAEWFDGIRFDDEDPSPKIFRAQGAEVILQATPEDEDFETLTVSFHYPGFQSISIVLDNEMLMLRHHSKSIGIGKLAAHDEAPSLLIQTYTGGAHCCYMIDAIIPVAGRFQHIAVGGWDGGALEAFPHDVDGDGHADFVLRDDAFGYAFGSYADSWKPPQVINIQHGQVVDVSAEPGFGHLFEAYSHRAREACARTVDKFRNGACAAYVASEARLGKLETALGFVDTAANQEAKEFLPRGCKVKYERVCPQGQVISFDNFSGAIRWFLREYGYVP